MLAGRGSKGTRGLLVSYPGWRRTEVSYSDWKRTEVFCCWHESREPEILGAGGLGVCWEGLVHGTALQGTAGNPMHQVWLSGTL